MPELVLSRAGKRASSRSCSIGRRKLNALNKAMWRGAHDASCGIGARRIPCARLCWRRGREGLSRPAPTSPSFEERAEQRRPARDYGGFMHEVMAASVSAVNPTVALIHGALRRPAGPKSRCSAMSAVGEGAVRRADQSYRRHLWAIPKISALSRVGPRARSRFLAERRGRDGAGRDLRCQAWYQRSATQEAEDFRRARGIGLAVTLPCSPAKPQRRGLTSLRSPRGDTRPPFSRIQEARTCAPADLARFDRLTPIRASDASLPSRHTRHRRAIAIRARRRRRARGSAPPSDDGLIVRAMTSCMSRP